VAQGTNDLLTETSDILLFANVQTTDAGSYTVVVSDTPGPSPARWPRLQWTRRSPIIIGDIVNDGGRLWGGWADYDNDGWLDLFVANTLARMIFSTTTTATARSPITKCCGQ
jgi:hypothetical protein